LRHIPARGPFLDRYAPVIPLRALPERNMSPRFAIKTFVTGMGSSSSQNVSVRTSSLSKPAILLLLAVCGCARKGDPVPASPVPPVAPLASWSALRRLDIQLPKMDVSGDTLRGLEAIRILYLPLGLARPSSQEVFSHGEVVVERRRPNLPGPGEVAHLNLDGLARPAGWIVVVAVRSGQVPSQPSAVLPWLSSKI